MECREYNTPCRCFPVKTKRDKKEENMRRQQGQGSCECSSCTYSRHLESILEAQEEEGTGHSRDMVEEAVGQWVHRIITYVSQDRNIHEVTCMCKHCQTSIKSKWWAAIRTESIEECNKWWRLSQWRDDMYTGVKRHPPDEWDCGCWTCMVKRWVAEGNEEENHNGLEEGKV